MDCLECALQRGVSKAFFKYMKKLGYKTMDDLNKLVKENPKEAINCQLDYLMQSNSWIYKVDKKGFFIFSGSKYEKEMPEKVKMPFDEYQKLKESPACLALIFHASYERSGDSIEDIDVRGKRANEWYEVLKNYE